MAVAEQDPNLALVALRIELEIRLRSIAEKHSIATIPSLLRLLHEVQKKEILYKAEFLGLQEILKAGNRAVHGVRVDPSLSNWVLTNGVECLSILNEKLKDD